MRKRKSVKCFHCQTENDISLSKCEKCGKALPVMKMNISRSTIVFSVILLAWASIFVYLSRDIIFHTSKMLKTDELVEKEKKGGMVQKRPKEKVPGQVEKKSPAKTAEVLKEDRKEKTNISAGWVIIRDPWGRQVRRFRAALAGNGWLALPARAALGGNRWFFNSDSDEVNEISGGLWINGDRVGLWHLIEDAAYFRGPELAAWDEGEPVSWLSLESAGEYHSLLLKPGRIDGFFISTEMPVQISENGVFIQNEKVVGWSFGHWMENAYMWPGSTSPGMEYRTWVRYFYNMTFAGGREEKFASALAIEEDYAGIAQLTAFVEGFRLQPKLSVDDTPDYLLPEEIIKGIRLIITDAVQKGAGNNVMEILSGQVLQMIGEVQLLIDIIPVIVSLNGFEAAIGEIEDSGRYFTRKPGYDAINKLHMHLYRDWLKALITDREIEDGLQTYDSAKTYFPDDPYIHLLGVELLLYNDDWEEAERLLYMRNYPAAFQDRYQLLALRIEEMKNVEEKILITFPRGSSRVTLTAVINEAIDQDFLVDTGATIVTIPSSTADALGLEVVPGDRTIATASGIVTVKEVIIDAIEVNGWVENNVRAIVLDMPGRAKLGLLGLNYLGRFEMDLRPEEGTLLLTPQ
ncbi:MAG: retropepsin-like aspartic protease [Nitrospirota bacterium]